MNLVDRIKQLSSKKETDSIIERVKKLNEASNNSSGITGGGTSGAITPTTFEVPTFAKTPVKTNSFVSTKSAGTRETSTFDKQDEKETMREDAKVKALEIKAKEEQRKASLSGAQTRLDALIAEDRQKFGVNPIEPDAKEQSRIRDNVLETRNIITANKSGFGTGIRESFGLEPTAKFSAQTATPERTEANLSAIEKARSQKGFTAGKVTGELGKQLALYATVGSALKGTQFFASLGAKFGGTKAATFAADQIADLFIDAVIQTPQEVLRGDTIKTIGMNRLLDIGINLGIGVGGEYLKSLKNADTQAFETAVKQLSPEDSKLLREALDTNVDVPLGPTTKTFESPTKTAVDDFQTWRSKNFGGATGKQSPDDIDTLRNLYFEDTGKYIGDADLKTFTKSQGELAIDAVKKRMPVIEPKDGLISAPSVNPIVDRVKNLTQPKASIVDRVKALQQDTPIKQTITPDAVKTLDTGASSVAEKDIIDLVGSPRESQFPTPEVGTSKASFIDTAKKSDVTTSELNKKIKQLELDTTTNEARTLAAKQIVEEDFEAAVRLVKEGDQFGSGIESEIGRDLIDKLQKQGRDAEAVEIIETLAKKFRRAGQDAQSASIWSKTTPEGMQKWATKTLDEAKVKVDPKLITEVGDDVRRINDMTPEELGKAVAERLGKLGEQDAIVDSIIKNNSFEELKSMNTAFAMNKIFDKIPIIKARKLSSIQAMSHLLNGRTFMRNIFGNTASITGEIISRVPASIADRGISMFTGNRSVLASMPPWKRALNNGFKEGKKSFFEIAAGVSKGKQSKYDLLFGSAFNSKLGKNLEKTLSVSLQTPDEFFKGFTKADSLYNQVRARLGKEVDNMKFDDIMGKATKEELETAVKEAEFATFQNDSGLAEFMSKTKAHLNRVHIDSNKKLFKETGEFGLGDLTLKYTRVPGNIITRGFEYSPIGYTKAASTIFDLASSGKTLTAQSQRELAMQIGRATTGTGLIALGMKLNDLGIISGTEDSKDYDVSAFNTAEGLGNYKINTSALARLATGGDPEKQEGDTLKSYNWAAPMTTPIAVGARLSAENPQNSKDALKSLGAATWEEAVDLPTMWVIKKMMFEGMSEDSQIQDILSVPLKESIPGFVPSVVRQTAQTIDPVIRETTTGDSPFLDKIKANIPFLSKTLPPKLDVLGRESTRTPGILPNLLDPASTTQFTPTDYGDTLRQIADLSGKTTVYPDRKSPTSFTYRGNVVKLTQDEKQKWQETEGKFVDQKYSEFLNGKTATNETDAIRLAAKLNAIKKEASEKAKVELLNGRGN